MKWQTFKPKVSGRYVLTTPAGIVEINATKGTEVTGLFSNVMYIGR